MRWMIGGVLGNFLIFVLDCCDLREIDASCISYM